uniref:Chemokine interleukin-8-like domain-containing protein n=1 Tax=Oryzias latipes TaxID=8090 RepID=A0A3B3I963_ORYLA
MNCSSLTYFCMSFSVAMAQMPVDCCLSVKNQTIDKIVVADYYPQAKGCALDATILVTRRKKTLCVPHDEQWVQDVKKHVDRLKRRCKENGYKVPICSLLGVPVKLFHFWKLQQWNSD